MECSISDAAGGAGCIVGDDALHNDTLHNALMECSISDAAGGAGASSETMRSTMMRYTTRLWSAVSLALPAVPVHRRRRYAPQ
jgi:hypothetical protein